jgi:hypothetical protein
MSSSSSLDYYLSHRHLNLLDLRQQLLVSQKQVKLELVDLINSDYADFISLSTNLSDVEELLLELSKPLDCVSLQTHSVHHQCQDILQSLRSLLSQKSQLTLKKSQLTLSCQILDSFDHVSQLLA